MTSFKLIETSADFFIFVNNPGSYSWSVLVLKVAPSDEIEEFFLKMKAESM